MTQDHQLQVEAIKCGTVIDHIPAHVGFKLLSLFKLTETDQRVTIGLNLPSNHLGKKDLIKIENTFLTEQQANQLAMYAPHATINNIENYIVVKKMPINLPDQIDSILVCPNSNCISHNEPVNSSFHITSEKDEKDDVVLRCKYCEKEFDRQAVIDND
ncbi:aspartate carbamoyltransferase regulatory subunit [Xenorhabdus japonica]|uniref:Aspartate carbamoyltransferase regulatory chain n=1 Tax=Xenorhabdus japonica TaxID=53341 RepID=A0A1I4YBX8_9GAMM|nr:aspartate carbamoyltransferase regulatory subunit [Xenorhabdus japonica]SFN35502.1 aspartate carbamoyltransferase regulatory subunit [Xenorhabdus japonica]